MSVRQFIDPDITTLLRRCSHSDLEPLLGYIESARTNTLGAITKQRLYANPHLKLVDDIVHEIQTFGGNSIANLVRRSSGVPYLEVAGDVARQLGADVEVEEQPSIEAIEHAIIVKILDDGVAKMSAEEKENFEKAVEEASGKHFSLRSGVPFSMVMAQAGVRMTGFFAYKMAVVVANAVAKAVLGRGLSLGANAALTRMIGVAAGPVGWVVSGLWTAVDLAGPAYRVTIPCVCHVGMLRKKLDFEELGSG